MKKFKGKLPKANLGDMYEIQPHQQLPFYGQPNMNWTMPTLEDPLNNVGAIQGILKNAFTPSSTGQQQIPGGSVTPRKIKYYPNGNIRKVKFGQGGNLPKALYGDTYEDDINQIQAHQKIDFSGPTAKTNYNYYSPKGADDILKDQSPYAASPEEGDKQGFKFPKLGFTTPGLGDMVGGVIGAANLLMPKQDDDQQYHRRQYGGYNQNPFGTGSQAIYAEGGKMDEPLTKSQYYNPDIVVGVGVGPRPVAPKRGMVATYEVPSNLGYGREQETITPLTTNTNTPYTPPTPVARPVPAYQMPKSVSFTRFGSPTTSPRGTYQPHFNGNWTDFEKQQYIQKDMPRSMYDMPVGSEDLGSRGSIPDVSRSFGYKTVGDAYEPDFRGPGWTTVDKKRYLREHVPQMLHGKPVLTDNLGFRNGGKMKKCEDGGKLSVGQKIALTPNQKAHYESLGYTFK